MTADHPRPGILRRYLPILTWGAKYSRRTCANDLIVAAIVTIMLIPQSLAYALLAGLPPQIGLYASRASHAPDALRVQGPDRDSQRAGCANAAGCLRPQN